MYTDSLFLLCLFILLRQLFPVFFGRDTQVSFHIFAEERQCGEIQFVGNFLDAFVRTFQQIFHILHDIAGNQVGSCFSGIFLADGRQVFGRDEQSAGIVAYGAFFGVGRNQQFDEGVEQVAGGIEAGGTQLDIFFQGILKLINECLQEGVDEFSLVTVGRSCQFGVEQVVVLTKKLAFLFVERNDGVLVQIQPRTPVLVDADKMKTRLAYSGERQNPQHSKSSPIVPCLSRVCGWQIIRSFGPMS